MTLRFRSLLPGCLALVFASLMSQPLASAQTAATQPSGNPEQPAPRRLLISGAQVLNVETGELFDFAPILIEGNTIAAMSAMAVRTADDAERLDLTGYVILPGLIDLHSHLLLHPYNEASWNDQVLQESLEFRTLRAVRHADDTLRAGFTTLRDLGTEGAGFADVALRDAIRQRIIPGPRVFAVTKALVTTGGYGPAGFDPRWKMPSGAQIADGPDGVRIAVREQIAAGADWIKVYADYRRKPGEPSTPTYSQAELNAIVDEATSAGLHVAAHASTDEGIRRAVLAGVKTIEHGYSASDDVLRLMQERDVVLCPTLNASESISRYAGWKPGMPDTPRIAEAKDLMRRALAIGVTIANGSDVGVFAHGENARELELLHEYGMPAADVIRCATLTAAKVLDQEGKLGVIAPGAYADLIAVPANPVEDLSVLRRIAFVMKDGEVIVNQTAIDQKQQ